MYSKKRNIVSRRSEAIIFHNKLADVWDSKYESGSFRKRKAFFVNNILKIMPPGGRWLDAGCGTGTFSRLIASAGREVVGVDAAPRMIAEARGIGGGGLTYLLIESLEEIDFAENSFDGVICLSVLEYTNDPLAVVRELIRVLRPQGVLILSVPNKYSAIRRAQRILNKIGIARYNYINHSRVDFSLRGLIKLLDKSGLEINKTFYFDPAISVITRSWFGILHSLIYAVCVNNSKEWFLINEANPPEPQERCDRSGRRAVPGRAGAGSC